MKMSVTLEGAVPHILLISILRTLSQKQTAEDVARVWGRKAGGLMKSCTDSEGKNDEQSCGTIRQLFAESFYVTSLTDSLPVSSLRSKEQSQIHSS